MSRIVTWLLALAMCGGLSSCSIVKLARHKKKKRTTEAVIDSSAVAVTPTPSPDTVKPVIDTTAATRQLIGELTPLWQKRLSYKTFAGKAKVHLETPDQDVDFSASFRIKKDSTIWIMISALGGALQIARIYVTPDSFFMINYQDKQYSKISLADVGKVLPSKIDFASLQNLLTGDPLREGSITHADAFGGAWTLDVEDTSYVQRVTYNKSDSTLRSCQAKTRAADGPQAMIQYGNYQVVDARRVSSNRVIHMQNGPKAYTIELDFTSMSFDGELEFPFSIPKSYKEKKIEKEQ